MIEVLDYMYLSVFLIFRLVFLPICYFFTVILLWSHIGVYVFLIGIIPLAVNILIFSSPFLNYLSILGFTFLALYGSGVFLDPILYDPLFLGIQAFTLCLGISISIIQNKTLPSRSGKYQKKINNMFRGKDNIMVTIDNQLHTINSISSSACKLYGWKKKDILNNSILTIYLEDPLYNAPEQFWETLKKDHTWHGFMDIKTKDGKICEERAYYSAIKNQEGEIIFIEKKIVEVFLKDKQKKNFDSFSIFFQECPIPMAVVNRGHIIEIANLFFVKNIFIKPIFFQSVFGELFAKNQREQIIVALNQAFEGIRTSFVDDFECVMGWYSAEYTFVPFYSDRYLKVTHVLFMVNLLEKRLGDYGSYLEEKGELLSLLKISLTDLYKVDPNHTIRLYSQSLPTLFLPKNPWKSVFDEILSFALKEGDMDPKTIIFSCIPQEDRLIFKVVFTYIRYIELSVGKNIDSVKMLHDAIEVVSDDIHFEQGENSELILNFLLEK